MYAARIQLSHSTQGSFEESMLLVCMLRLNFNPCNILIRSSKKLTTPKKRLSACTSSFEVGMASGFSKLE